MIRLHGNFMIRCGTWLIAAWAITANADTWDKKTVVNLGETVEIPGAVLPPGQYVIKLVDSQSNRHIVQFLNADENHVYNTVLSIPNERLRPTGKTILSYYEMPAGQPPALRAWFYPGDVIGEEFAYPNNRAAEISKVTKQNVLVAPEDVKPVAYTPASNAAANDSATASAATPAANDPAPATPVEPASAQTPDTKPETGPDAASEAEKMPKTASNLPLMGLLGASSLAAAATVRMFRKRAA